MCSKLISTTREDFLHIKTNNILPKKEVTNNNTGFVYVKTFYTMLRLKLHSLQPDYLENKKKERRKKKPLITKYTPIY